MAQHGGFMRGIGELFFRARQEFLNLSMYLRPPRAPRATAWPRPHLPSPALVLPRLRGTDYAATVEALARQIVEHRFPLLGTVVESGPSISWRRDYELGVQSGLSYFRRVSYLDLSTAGDFKVVFEINRHQHLILLAQAHLLTDRPEFADEVHRQLESWLADNPFARGINWTSALEVALRALSWIWVYHWIGSQFPESLSVRFLESLFRHGCYIQHNLSVYFSPNTHLLGEAVTLHLLGRVFPEWPRAADWERQGHEIIVAEMEKQVLDDGGYFEQSSHYHTYATDFFLLHKLFAQSTPASYDARLILMAQLLDALIGPRGSIPLLGDDDGGRIFHPYGRRDRFARGTLAVAAAVFDRPEWLRRDEDRYELAAWWLGDAAFAVAPVRPVGGTSTIYRHTGLAILRAADVTVIADVGPLGSGIAAHSHADALSITASDGIEEILIDPGTFTYVDMRWRNRFRGTAAHSTVRVDECDQASPGHAFQWKTKPEVRIRSWRPDKRCDYLDAECRYGGVTHRRAVVLIHDVQCLFVLDRVEGPPGDHTVEQLWHPAGVVHAGPTRVRIGSRAKLIFPVDTALETSTEGEFGWRSRALRHREPAFLIRVSKRGTLPVVMGAVLDFSERGDDVLTVRVQGNAAELHYGGETVRIEPLFD